MGDSQQTGNVVRLFCEVESCDQPVHSRSRFCAGHAKRFQLGQSMDGEPLKQQRLSLRERIMGLAVDLVECDTDDDNEFERCWDALKHAAVEWADGVRSQRAAIARSEALTPERRKAIAKMGGKARSESMTDEQRQASAAKAAKRPGCLATCSATKSLTSRATRIAVFRSRMP